MLFVKSPSGRVELVDNSVMLLNYVGWNWGKDTVEISIEDTNSLGVVFGSVLLILIDKGRRKKGS